MEEAVVDAHADKVSNNSHQGQVTECRCARRRREVQVHHADGGVDLEERPTRPNGLAVLSTPLLSSAAKVAHKNDLIHKALDLKTEQLLLRQSSTMAHRG